MNTALEEPPALSGQKEVGEVGRPQGKRKESRGAE